MRFGLAMQVLLIGVSLAAANGSHGDEAWDVSDFAEGPSGSVSTSVTVPQKTDRLQQPASARPSPPAIQQANSPHGKREMRTGAGPAPQRLALDAPSGRLDDHSSDDRPAKTWLDFRADSPVVTTLAALSIVAGLFLLLAWGARRRMPGAAARLPDEIIEVLGRKTLAAKQSLHLVRIGGKLIVVSVTAEGCETLTEVTDPNEVARILSACRREQPQSSSADFRQVLESFGRQPASGFLDSSSGRRETTAGIGPRAA